jgi:hypothetical protein
LKLLEASGQKARLVEDAIPRAAVIYERVTAVPLNGQAPEEHDVLVPVPGGYPAGLIDGAALEIGNGLLPRLAGGNNPQGDWTAENRTWRLASYHPHQGGGGPAWDPTRHGFHTYVSELIQWLSKRS